MSKPTGKGGKRPTAAIEQLLKRKLTTVELAIFCAGHLAGQQNAERKRRAAVRP